MTEMKKHIYDESNGLWYALIGDYYIPVLTMSSEEQRPIGKWGRMYRDYIKEHRPWLYTELLFGGKLVSHLNSIDDTAHQRMELLIQQIQEQQGVNEELKFRDQMGWVGACNNIRNAAEEIVLNELIYC